MAATTINEQQPQFVIGGKGRIGLKRSANAILRRVVFHSTSKSSNRTISSPTLIINNLLLDDINDRKSNIENDDEPINGGDRRQQHCQVPANQIELDFASLTALPFLIRVRAPNAETSTFMHFPVYGKTSNYSPKLSSCGHGNWTIDVYQRIDHRIQQVHTQRIYLDGVGSLFFSIADDLIPKLSSQEFLRLPSASRCCGRVARLVDDIDASNENSST